MIAMRAGATAPRLGERAAMGAIHFLTFGGGAPHYRGAAARLSRQAARTGLFRSITCGSLASLRRDYPDLWRRHRRFLLTAPRGGYWLWKPLLIAARLHEITDGDFLVYADAGCEFAKHSEADLSELLPAEPQTHLTIIPLESHNTIERWTNGHCLVRHDPAGAFRRAPQFSTGILCFKNSPATRALVCEWLDGCVDDDCACLVDRHGETEAPAFEEHRYDQSILCLAAYRLERDGAIGLKRIDVSLPHYQPLPILGIRNRTPFTVQRNRKVHWGLWKTYRLLSHLFWSEERYRTRLLATLDQPVPT